jgi:hypothetical protein
MLKTAKPEVAAILKFLFFYLAIWDTFCFATFSLGHIAAEIYGYIGKTESDRHLVFFQKRNLIYFAI